MPEILFRKDLNYARDAIITSEIGECDRCHRSRPLLVFGTDPAEYGEMQLCLLCLTDLIAKPVGTPVHSPA